MCLHYREEGAAESEAQKTAHKFNYPPEAYLKNVAFVNLRCATCNMQRSFQQSKLSWWAARTALYLHPPGSQVGAAALLSYLTNTITHRLYRPCARPPAPLCSENATVDECAELVRSGAILDQFNSRFRPQLRAPHRSASHPAPPPAAAGSKEPSPRSGGGGGGSQQKEREREHHPPARTQSSGAERGGGHGGGGGGGGGSASTAGRQGAAAAAAAAAAAPSPSKTGSRTVGGGAGGEEEEEGEGKERKRKGRWVVYKDKHTVWVSERTASGNSLSIPGGWAGGRVWGWAGTAVQHAGGCALERLPVYLRALFLLGEGSL